AGRGMADMIPEERHGFVNNVVGSMKTPTCPTNYPGQSLLENLVIVVRFIEVRDPAARIDKERLAHGCFPYSTSSIRREASGSPDAPQPAAARKRWRAVS